MFFVEEYNLADTQIVCGNFLSVTLNTAKNLSAVG